MKLTFPEIKLEVIDCLKKKLVPMVHGSAGIGKSAVMREIAEQFNLVLIDIRLSQYDVCDLNGFPRIKDDVASYVPMDVFPTSEWKIPEGKNGWLLFLDEFNSASLSVQAGSYKLILDRMVGNEPLHEKVLMACAGNLLTDNAIVNRIGTAMQSRLVHFEQVSDKDVFLNHAHKAGFDHRISSFVEFRPDLLNKFSPNHNDFTFPCERTWEFVSKIIEDFKVIPRRKLFSLAGAIGEGAAREFYSFCEIYEELPDLNEILRIPTKAEVPTEPSMLYAMTGCLGSIATKKNLTNLMKYIDRMPAEFQVITLRTMVKRDRDLLACEAIKNWFNTTGQELI